ncbi:multidrug resistance associated protein 7 [Echinococcus multilocularis]|uniref:Multidrug resistance associated protein 7 n=1 Tax=Echinococcus multilocularis TaxID=6211 RepID=A0A068YEB2_ECHMU|nr:multidrug resistance associated protein 7 [Echinococcus multilocularis]
MLNRKLPLEEFCGDLSVTFWEGQSVGLCLSELSLHIPFSFVLSIASLVYVMRIFPTLAFEWPFTRWIVFRIILDLFVLIKSAAFLVISVLSLYTPASYFSYVCVANNATTLLCMFCVTMLDMVHGKGNYIHSRGPICILIVEVLYFYVASLQMWSVLSHGTFGEDRNFMVSLVLDCFFLGIRLLTKTPIIHPVENERMRRARSLRQLGFNTIGQAPDRPNLTEFTLTRTETSASFVGKLLFTWINETIVRGYYGELFSLRFLPLLPKSLSAKTLEEVSNVELTVCKIKTKFDAAIPLISRLFVHFGTEFLVLGLIKFAFSVTSLLSPVFLNKFIVELVHVSTDWKPALLWGVALILSHLMNVFLGTAYTYWTPRFGLKIKVYVTTLVYRQLMRLRSSTLSKFSTGNLVNLLTSDTERVVNLTPSFNELWAMPVQVIVAVWLLYCQVGVSCFVGVAILILLLPLNRVITSLIGRFSSDLMHHKDLRVKLVSEMLHAMTTVKLACWEHLMRRKILNVRHCELNALRGQKFLPGFASWINLCNFCRTRQRSLSSKVPMNALPWVLNGVVEAWISAGRICRLFETDDLTVCSINPAFSADDNPREPSQIQGNSELVLKSPLFYWESVDNPALTDLNVTISMGQLIGVIGPIASGKSSFLLALMGELQTPVPQSMSAQLRFAYVGFTPWLQKGSILANILFGEPLESKWLAAVVDACGLSEDLAEMPEGMDTEVGEAGSRLSGGQKARVALARAVYQRADVYLFDDPLASLDTHVAHSIIQKCIGQRGILAGKTRIFATHKSEWLFNEEDMSLGGPADRVITLSEGRIVQQWTSQNRTVQSISNEQAYFISNGEVSSTPDSSFEGILEDRNEQTPLLSFSPEEDNNRAFDSAEDEVSTDWEKFAFGSITSRVYRSYVRALGFCLASWVLISLTLMQASRNGQDYWLSYWMQEGELNITSPSVYSFLFDQSYDHPFANVPAAKSNKFYFSVYGGIIGANLIFTMLRAVLFALAGLQAAATIHQHMLDAVLQGEMHFFEVTPLGRILNRFSSDVGTIDDSLPFLLNIFLAILFSLLGSLVVTCFAMPGILVICLPLLFVYWSVQRVYRTAARDLKRLSSTARSPVYAHFSETIGGLVVIRGLHKEAAFQAAAGARLNAQTRCELTTLAAAAWLNLRLQLIALLVVVCVVLISLFGRAVGLLDVSLAGLAVIYALMLASSMTALVTTMSDTEKDFVAVERCRELTEETPFEVDIVACSAAAPRRRQSLSQMRFIQTELPTCSQVDVAWPKAGRISFEDVYLLYPSATTSTEQAAAVVEENAKENFALSGVSLKVEAGEHIGVVGRTGSGKSSLLRVLFRLVPHLGGPATNPQIARLKNFRGATGTVKVDDVDVRQVPLKILRSRMLCVSQDPFLFSGTVRENLDPDGSYSDDQLTDILIRCGLVNKENGALAFLSSEVGEAGRNLSAGQRQLLCLARALFRLSPARHSVICLDEATSSLDDACERKIQDMLVNEFANSTVLLVAHRLSTVLSCCSRVVVMNFGRIVEEGSPQHLAQIPTSYFYKMLHNHDSPS